MGDGSSLWPLLPGTGILGQARPVAAAAGLGRILRSHAGSPGRPEVGEESPSGPLAAPSALLAHSPVGRLRC